jgi:hypothetical protein
MKYLHLTSWALLLAGMALVAVWYVAGLDAVWLLGGVLLAWAGIVKIAIVLIWTRLAHMGTERHLPEKSV